MDTESNQQTVSENDLKTSIELLERLVANPEAFAEIPQDLRVSLIAAAGRLSRPSKEESRARNKAFDRANRRRIVLQDRKARAATGIREARTHTVFSAPLQIADGRTSEQTLNSPRNCYVCKAEFVKLHHFYDTMCPACADFNYQKRFQTADLTGQVAIITGSRLKIGYHATLMMLRAGAKVIATTRFPIDSAMRFSKEADFSTWKDRLEIHGLDLRHTPSVELFCRYIEQRIDRLDILINNAAQTVRRPPGFYAHMMESERAPLSSFNEDVRALLNSHEECKRQLNAAVGSVDANLPVAWNASTPGVGIRASAELSQIPYSYD
ncbi:MAG TPA: SDR family NAD(P)-dependent oxidoreductase, partial [Bdellovibrionales bacterium]|nr:SDR family NAD(P)-dependent oxidoreductase [Bdellovibrionales bacterium]